MTEQEKLNSKVKRKIAVQNANIQALTEELRDFKEEMRQQNKMRAEETATLRTEMNAQITEIRTSINSLDKNMRNQTIVTFLGIAAMVTAILLK